MARRGPDDHAPLCLRDEQKSIEECRFLNGNEGELAVLRVQNPRPWGVAGMLYKRTLRGWLHHSGEPWLPYGDSRLDGMLASKLIMELRDVTIVDVREVMAQ
ncbi:hypothetical protein GCM10010357_67650 [Streptomyces luteireticuli]|uniref:Uncharacterized protein n=2 Tax=Streptomyces luteireticuli TaxID=173858 RepID=A0ABN0Z7Q4_9ACTN